jgi:DNA-binding ferritin-like protein
MSKKISIMESALANYDWYQREASIQASSIDSLMKKAIKYKEIKEENKKLKKLLQNQLENNEKVREETQKTMKVLRDEFDTLVKEMSKQNIEK